MKTRLAFVHLLSVAFAVIAAGCTQAKAHAERGEPPPSAALRTTMTSPTACGAQGHDCPLQGWMKNNASPPMTSTDFPRLEHAFERIASLSPAAPTGEADASYAEWSELAHAGAAAARDHDLDGSRVACKRCHDAYRSKYRAEHRAAPLR